MKNLNLTNASYQSAMAARTAMTSRLGLPNFVPDASSLHTKFSWPLGLAESVRRTDLSSLDTALRGIRGTSTLNQAYRHGSVAAKRSLGMANAGLDNSLTQKIENLQSAIGVQPIMSQQSRALSQLRQVISGFETSSSVQQQILSASKAQSTAIQGARQLSQVQKLAGAFTSSGNLWPTKPLSRKILEMQESVHGSQISRAVEASSQIRSRQFGALSAIERLGLDRQGLNRMLPPSIRQMKQSFQGPQISKLLENAARPAAIHGMAMPRLARRNWGIFGERNPYIQMLRQAHQPFVGGGVGRGGRGQGRHFEIVQHESVRCSDTVTATVGSDQAERVLVAVARPLSRFVARIIGLVHRTWWPLVLEDEVDQEDETAALLVIDNVLQGFPGKELASIKLEIRKEILDSLMPPTNVGQSVLELTCLDGGLSRGEAPGENRIPSGRQYPRLVSDDEEEEKD